MPSPYVEWLRRRQVPLFEGAGVSWRLYHGALVPAASGPCFLDVDASEARRLLRDSGAWLLRYSSDPTDSPTEWWYVVCDRYDPKSLTSKMRNKINQGRRRCAVRSIETDWLADNGYACYEAAFSRYGNKRPVPPDAWREEVLRTAGGPAEHWGVFVDSRLVGYTRCLVDGNNVASAELKLDPQYLRERGASALVSHLQEHYVGQMGKTMSNGNRAVSHETSFQEFLLEHGFRKQYCRLNVEYRGLLRGAIGALYPLRRTIRGLRGGVALDRLRSLLVQEEWRRATGSGGPV